MSEDKVEDNVVSYLSLWETTKLNDLNVVRMLHNFWEQKQINPSSSSLNESEDLSGETGCRTDCLLLYESSSGSSCVCYVTLPGGSCFGNYKVCNTPAEARRDAARVALMNSLVNELPCRQITSQFITQSLQQAASDGTMSIEDASNSDTSLGIYSLLLHSYIGKTMLQFQEMMTIFQLLHWNGNLKVLRDRQYSRQSVISYYSQRGLTEYMRSSMALDWLGREQKFPGRVEEELKLTQRELAFARRRGQELRFYKEKTEILSLALCQAYVHSTLKTDQATSYKNKQEHLLYRICSQESECSTSPPCSPLL